MGLPRPPVCFSGPPGGHTSQNSLACLPTWPDCSACWSAWRKLVQGPGEKQEHTVGNILSKCYVSEVHYFRDTHKESIKVFLVTKELAGHKCAKCILVVKSLNYTCVLKVSSMSALSVLHLSASCRASAAKCIRPFTLSISTRTWETESTKYWNNKKKIS